MNFEIYHMKCLNICNMYFEFNINNYIFLTHKFTLVKKSWYTFCFFISPPPFWNIISKEKKQMALMVSQTHLTLQNSWLALTLHSCFSTKVFDFGVNFSVHYFYGIQFYFTIMWFQSMLASKIQFSLTACSSIM